MQSDIHAVGSQHIFISVRPAYLPSEIRIDWVQGAQPQGMLMADLGEAVGRPALA